MIIVAVAAACQPDHGDGPIGQDSAADEGAGTDDLECRRQGHPCSWSEADPEARARTIDLLDDIGRHQNAGADFDTIVALLEDQPDVVDLDAGSAAITFRVDGDQPAHVFTPLAGRLPDDLEPDALPARPSATAAAALPHLRLAAFDPAGRPGRGNDPDGKRAIVIEPFGPMSQHWSGSRLARQLADTEQYTVVDHVAEDQLDFSTMLGLDDYDVVHVSGHGWDNGVVGQPMAPYYDIDEEGNGSLRDDVDIPVGVTSGTSYGVKVFAYTADFFRAAFPGGLDDTLFFADWCQSAMTPELASAIAANDSAFVGWTESVGMGFAARSAGRLWQYLAGNGADIDLALEQLDDDGLVTAPPDDTLDAAVRDFVECRDGTCEARSAAELRHRGVALRARDVVTSLDVDLDRITAGTVLDWDGSVDDGQPDTLDEITVLVEAVEHGRKDEVVIELFLDGRPFPEQLGLGDAQELPTADLWSGWELTATDLELPFDVTDERLAPNELRWEVRVRDTDTGHSAHLAEYVFLERRGVELLHPVTLGRLDDGAVVEVDGVEGDGEPDVADVVFEVTGVPPEDVEDVDVVVTIRGLPMAVPRTRTYPLAELEQVGERTWRHRDSWTFDGDVTDDADQPTIDAVLVRNDEEQAAHEVTVQLEGEEPSGCWFEIEWSARGEFVTDEGNRGSGREGPLSDRADPDPSPTVEGTEPVTTIAHDRRSGEGAVLAIPVLEGEDYGVMVNALEGYGQEPTGGAPFFHWWLDLGAHVPPGETGSFTVPYVTDGVRGGMRLLVTGGAGYSGPVDVDLTVNDVVHSDFSQTYLVRRLEGSFSANSADARVRGDFAYDWDDC